MAGVGENHTTQRDWQCSTCNLCHPSTGSTDAARIESRDCACKTPSDSTTAKQQAKTRLYTRPPSLALNRDVSQKHSKKEQREEKWQKDLVAYIGNFGR